LTVTAVTEPTFFAARSADVRSRCVALVPESRVADPLECGYNTKIFVDRIMRLWYKRSSFLMRGVF
jgi:hypothetical protein